MLKNELTMKEFGYRVEDLTEKSGKPINLKCDYCNTIYQSTKKIRAIAHKKLDKDACKKCRYEKRKEIELRDYGGTNPFARKSVKDKIKKTNLDKYGVESYTQTDEFKEKSKKTNLDKYGVENVMHSEEIKNKQRASLKESYGVENPSQCKDIQDRKRKTNLKKYGNEQFLASNQCRQTKIDKGIIKIYGNKTMGQWAEEVGKPYDTFVTHVRKYGFEEAIKIPAYCNGLESKVRIWLDEENIEYKQHAKIENRYCDFLINNLVIELDGLYWHSDKVIKDNNYHIDKKSLYNKLGYKSLFFREHEVNLQFDIVKSMIRNQLGLGNKIFARKCDFVQIDKKKAQQFYIDNHLMGVGMGTPYALKHNGQIVSILQIKRIRNNEYEISRFCSILNTNILGGFSKLLKNIERVVDMSSLKTFIDCRYGTGHYLGDFGFSKESCYKSFKWVNGQYIVNRMKFPGNSGYQEGYAKIWDCGQTKYVKYY